MRRLDVYTQADVGSNLNLSNYQSIIWDLYINFAVKHSVTRAFIISSHTTLPQ